jgi:hypothetical protein
MLSFEAMERGKSGGGHINQLRRPKRPLAAEIVVSVVIVLRRRGTCVSTLWWIRFVTFNSAILPS